MDDQVPQRRKPTNPRRKKRSKFQIFKETYLPVIIAAAALLLILIFIIGSITRAVQRSNAREQAAFEASIAAAAELERLTAEAKKLSGEATRLAASYDYDGALTLLGSFSGNINDFPQLQRQYLQYEQAKSELVSWEDPSTVPNLSIQLLIADPERAFQNPEYGSSFYKNFLTIHEFSRILQQLYENGYILISMSDITEGTQPKPLSLPVGKKPLMLTQTQVNYYTYMTDSNGDNLPDKDGAGFASRLVVDVNGNLTCEYVTAAGETVTGAYDMVPILEAFIATHPDFSYRGARATLAVTGYDGIFGYRINAKARERLGEEAYQQEIAQATAVVGALRNAGYTIACGTYENAGYGSYSALKIKNDLTQWTNEVAPILGVVDTLVYARNSDIANAATDYEGDKFRTLQDFGFISYLGFATNGIPWFSAKDTHIRQGRILVTGSNLTSRAAWFTGIFDPSFILDPIRQDYNF